MNLQNSCILLGGKLERTRFLPSIYMIRPFWAPDKQAKVHIFEFGSISSRYFMTPRTQGWEFALLLMVALLS